MKISVKTLKGNHFDLQVAEDELVNTPSRCPVRCCVRFLGWGVESWELVGGGGLFLLRRGCGSQWVRWSVVDGRVGWVRGIERSLSWVFWRILCVCMVFWVLWRVRWCRWGGTWCWYVELSVRGAGVARDEAFDW